MNELQSWLASSQDPTKVSATVTGAIVSLSSFIVAFAQITFHVQLVPEQISQLATGLGMTAGAIWFLFGLFRKVAVKMGSRYPKTSGIVLNPED